MFNECRQRRVEAREEEEEEGDRKKNGEVKKGRRAERMGQWQNGGRGGGAQSHYRSRQG